MKHTPGPWHVYNKGRGLFVDSRTAGGICKVAEKGASEQQLANAYLLAAAPELLASLEEVIATWAEYRCVCELDGQDNHAPMCPVAKAEAVIKKAKGEL